MAWKNYDARTPGGWPPPQRPPEQGTMTLPDGMRLLRKPGRCSACGFHVEAQGGHRTYCPRTGQPGDL